MRTVEELKKDYFRNIEIREELENGLSRRAAAAKYNLAVATIGKIARVETFEEMQKKIIDRIQYVEHIVKEFTQGKTASDIATEIGTTKQNISRILRIANVSRYDGGVSKQKKDKMEQVITLYEQGKTFNQISEMLDLEADVLRNYTYELGIKVKSDTKIKVKSLTNSILDLNDEGKTQSEISEILEISQSYVSRILLQHNVRTLEKPEVYLKRNQEVLKMYLEEKSVHEIAEYFDLSEPNVRRIIYKFI